MLNETCSYQMLQQNSHWHFRCFFPKEVLIDCYHALHDITIAKFYDICMTQNFTPVFYDLIQRALKATQ